MSTRHILFKNIIPPLMPYISINFMNSARGIIFGSVGLYFIGVLPYSAANWGVMLNETYSNLVIPQLSTWWPFLIITTTILVFSLGLVLLAQGMDRVFNPRIRARHSDTAGSAEEDDGVSSDGEPTSSVRQI